MAANITVTPDPINYTLERDRTNRFFFTVYNSGDTPDSITLSVSQPYLTLSATSVSLDALEKKSLYIDIDYITAPAHITDTLHITGSAPNLPLDVSIDIPTKYPVRYLLVHEITSPLGFSDITPIRNLPVNITEDEQLF